MGEDVAQERSYDADSAPDQKQVLEFEALYLIRECVPL
jgi:hypothetical protein